MMLMNAVGWASVGPQVYEFADRPFKVKELAAKKATGWAMPVTISYIEEVELWVSTELGNRMLKIGPNSAVLTEAFLRLGQTEDGHLAVHFLDEIPTDDIIGEWNVAGPSNIWTLKTQVSMGETATTEEVTNVKFDLVGNGVQVGSIRESYFKKMVPSATFADGTDRLMLPCSELAERNGVAATISVGGIPIQIKKMDEFYDKRSGLCGTDLKLSFIYSNVIGRNLLSQYDVILDGRNRKLHVLTKGSFYPKSPLVKYRLDSQFRGSTESAFRWILAPGPVKEGDFIITHMDTIFPQSFGVICFFEKCIYSLFPGSRTNWIGAPIIDIHSDGIEFSENLGWHGYVVRATDSIQSIEIQFRYIGLRMNTDWTKNVEGERVEYYPVRGSKTKGEFTIPAWPPIMDNGIRIRHVLNSDSIYLVSKTSRWLGTPRFEVSDDKRIIITADKTSSECNRVRELQLPSSGNMRIDFSVEVCKYRQIDSGAPGYAFEPLPRESTDMNELEFRIKGTKVQKSYNGVPFSFYTWAPRGAHRWSPDLTWTADPVATLDPVTRMITITPSGPLGWKYDHGWRADGPEAAFLEFKPIAKRMVATAKFSLTDDLWEFIPASSDSEGPQFTIRKETFIRKGKDGGLVLLLEDVSGQIFDEPLGGTYLGIPTVAFLASGAVEVRPKEGFRPTFDVVASYPTPELLRISFTPTEYAQFGSIPTKTGNSDEICGICHDELDPEETVAKTKCRHFYHLSCLRRIEQRVCPYCRTSLDLF